MALGIGATAAVYSVLYAVLVDPYPYHDAAHIAAMSVVDKTGGKQDAQFTQSEIDLLRQTHSVAGSRTSVMGDRLVSKLVTGGDVPESIHAAEGTGNMLQFLDVRPLLGRVFTVSDAPEGTAPQPVAVISYLFWKGHFAADPGVIGRPLQLDHRTYTVIGVMGPRMTWLDAEVYLPLPADLDPQSLLQPMFRVPPATTMEVAKSEMESTVRQIAHDHPQAFPHDGFRIELESLNDYLLGQFKGTLLTLFVAVAFLLLIGCGNVSILMLARGAAREYELSMRSALGATRGRIVRQLLTETVLLSVSGGVAGIALAYGAVHLIVALIPEYSIPHEVSIGINVPVVLFSAAVSVATGLLAGLWPALQLSRPQVYQTIQATGTKSSTSTSGRRARSALLTGQIAVTVLLLAASGAAIRHFLEAYRADLGFNPHRVLLLLLRLPEHGYESWQARVNYQDATLQKLATLPRSEGAAVESAVPPDGNWVQQVDVSGGQSGAANKSGVYLVSSDYFSVLKIPLLQGRAITRSEVLRGAHVAVVSALFAQRYLHKGAILGRQMRMKELAPDYPGVLLAPDADQPYTIVGVAADIRNDGLHRPAQPQVYVPCSVVISSGSWMMIRTSGDPNEMIRPASEALRDLNGLQAVARSYVLDEYLGEFVWARERFISTLFGFFSSLALGLAAIGLVSVVAFAVEQRTREIGIRSALGASRLNILRLVIRPSLLSAGAGMAIGIGLSAGLSDLAFRWTESSMRSWTVLLGVSAVLLVLTVLASVFTARRAMKIDPVEALRAQ